MGVCATITASLGNDASRVCLLNPLLNRKDETIKACRVFNSLEFGTIKIRVHQLLPYSKELNGIAIAQPIGEEELTILSLQHVCQADVVIFILLNDRYLRILYCYFCHIVCCTTKTVSANLLLFPDISKHQLHI